MEIVDYNCVYFSFSRFQPPTTGHAENFKAVKILLKWVIGSYISHNL